MRILKLFYIFLITVAILLSVTPASHSREVILYSFEKDPQGWEIPDWAFGKPDHVAKQMGISEFQSSEGKYSLQVDSEFTGSTGWEGSYVEKVVEVTDWTPFNYLSVDVFIPKNAPRGLKGRIILSVGEGWKWIEMNKPVPLTPGEWVVIKVDLTPASMNWRKFVDDGFRADIRKIGVRAESNGKINYNGPVYIDNVKLSD